MAKIEKAREEVIDFIKEIIESHDLDAFATFRYFECEKQKEFIKVAKANATTEYFAQASDMCTIFVNPKIWDRLEDNHRKLLVENALNGVYFDEKEDGSGRMVVEQPNMLISSECYQKFGAELVDAAVIATYALKQIKEEEKRAKEEKKNAKSSGWYPTAIKK